MLAQAAVERSRRLMKILYHHRTASRDGQSVHIDELIHALREQGHEVHVVGPKTTSADAMGAQLGWVHRLRRALPKAMYELLELAYSALAYRRLHKAAKAFGPDVVYERYNLYLLAGLALCKRMGLPLLLEVNAPLAEERTRFGGLGLPWLARWAEGLTWRGATYVLPVTQVLAGHVLARGVSPERVVVIPNGINETHFRNAPGVEEAKAALGWSGALILGFTGFVRDWHGVDRVLRWLAAAETPRAARLLVVGDGPARADLERLANELNLRDRVRFTGVVGRDQIPRLVASFDIALQPAVVAYASPLKLFEYLAMGKAIVAPRQPNIEEILVDGANALLFDASVPGALEQALSRLCHDTDLRSQVAQGAASTIRALSLTWHQNARRVVELIPARQRSAAAAR